MKQFVKRSVSLLLALVMTATMAAAANKTG